MTSRPVAVEGWSQAPRLLAGTRIRALTWNLRFGAGARRVFFYEEGRDSRLPRAEVLGHLEGIADLLRRLRPDVVVLQEVDRGSDRTAGIDEWEFLRLQAGLRDFSWSSHPYHRVRWLPVPVWQPMGRIDLHLIVASRYFIERARAWPLPDPVGQGRLRRLFDLKRAVLDAEIPVDRMGHALRVLNTHLSAFTFGDGTLERQVACLRDLAQGVERGQDPFLLGGDFNCLPPGDDSRRLGRWSKEYPEGASPLGPLFAAGWSPVSPERCLSEPARHRSYAPPPGDAADRQLDYWFASAALGADEPRAMTAGLGLSDHLPVLTEFVSA